MRVNWTTVWIIFVFVAPLSWAVWKIAQNFREVARNTLTITLGAVTLVGGIAVVGTIVNVINVLIYKKKHRYNKEIVGRIPEFWWKKSRYRND
ncbi:MAG: hypothetical protein ACXAC2_05610 [Candidatus Kariarchaeaceae archaeon]|jgi:hypothetical protein